MRRGFSLVELSIVLVILGLLTGGILAGKSLIRASELRSVATEYQRWVTATYTFREKYMDLPGDFRDATRVWGLMDSTVSVYCTSISGAALNPNGTGACDGTGDGIIDNNGYAAPGANRAAERYQYWRHLALAGLIEGTYNGKSGAGSHDHNPGVNTPTSKFTNAFWGTYYNATAWGFEFDLGAKRTNNGPVDPAFRSEEAWNLDTKLDDGKPRQGKIYVRSDATNCYLPNVGNVTDPTAEYLLSDSGINCAFTFPRVFGF